MNEKILQVAKYLAQSDKNLRAKALVKLADYLKRGYDNELIARVLASYIKKEDNEKLNTYAKKILAATGAKLGSSKKHKTSILASKNAKIALGGVLVIFVLLLFVDFGSKEQKPVEKKPVVVYKGPVSKKQPEKQTSIEAAIDLNNANTMKLDFDRDFNDLEMLKAAFQVRFNPPRRKILKSRVKVVQSTNSNGFSMGKKELSFVFQKKVIKKTKSSIKLSVVLKDVKGNVKPELLGFPSEGEIVFLEISRNFSVSKVRSKDKRKRNKSYVFPFPIFSDEPIMQGSNWGTNMSNARFGVNTQYTIDGILREENKNLFKISFLSVSESRGGPSIFHVDRKGVFLVDSTTGIPNYLKLRTVSKTRLKGSGFPIEHEMLIEENAL